jgi:hypothetical protein
MKTVANELIFWAVILLACVIYVCTLPFRLFSKRGYP